MTRMMGTIVCVVMLLGLSSVLSADEIGAAKGVITRQFGDKALHEVKFEIIPAMEGRDVLEYQANAGLLTIRGSSPVALCRGYYEYIKSQNLGIVSWTGNRLDMTKPWPDVALTRIVSPYKYRYDLNVVTYGYTMPYWTWDRWQRELDWMALHGINMPLALVGTEAISERVWQKLGINQSDIDEFYTAPGHLPWQRMGNIAKVDGPLPKSWHVDQIAMQHQILDRMRELAMHPVAPGFAGFVPKGLARVHPELNLTSMKWSNFKEENRNHILSPDSQLFIEIGRMHIQEWEKEFGKNTFYLSDSFNEMELPTKDPAEKSELLKRYGDIIYQSIHAGNPDAVWVMQGWMFGYQRNIWTHDALQSLLSKVPDDKMIILDESIDYTRDRFNFNYFDGFFNKQYVIGYIPNMGGKTAYTGDLRFYAQGGTPALTSKNRGRLVGFGMVPEGIENNEIVYELICDMGFREQPADLNTWTENYSKTRYGSCPAGVQKAWQLLLESSYSNLVDHPSYNWQHRGGTRNGRASSSDKVMQAANAFLSDNKTLGSNPLYVADAIEMSTMALGLRAQQLLQIAMEAQDFDEIETRKQAGAQALTLLADIDRLLASHPNLKLRNWIDLARAHGTTPEEKDKYESNAKLLITLWGSQGEISDYSCRMWSGLIGSYYIPRWKIYFENLDGQNINVRKFESQWYQTPTTNAPQPYTDPISRAMELLDQASKPLPDLPEHKQMNIANWTPGILSTDWKPFDWSIKGKDVQGLLMLKFEYTAGAHRLDVRHVRLMDGETELDRDNHTGTAGTPSNNNLFRIRPRVEIDPDKTYILRADIRSDGGTDSNGKITGIYKKP